MSNPEISERLLDLHIAESTTGLDAAGRTELASLLKAADAEPEDFTDIVAALTVAMGERRRMPSALRAKILAAAPAIGRPAAQRTALAGWWVAAASIVLAVAGWWPRLAGNPGVPATADAATGRTALLSAPGTVKVTLAPGPGAAGAALTGDVVFDPVTQRGYLLFRGIPANDPRLARYQLWIADKSRAQPEPVDGGVFDVAPQATAAGDVIIPFSARLPVGAPAAFVITEEQPAGVVVSKQEKVLAIGAVPAGA
ncbi:MAG: anti-sigma factor [Steroidobacteraceae bacterium]